MAERIVTQIDARSDLIKETSELKWGKVKRRNVPMYRAAVEGYFEARAKNYVQYYALVIDTHKADHKRFNDGDKEIGFSKYLFTLLYKFARIWKPEMRLYVFLDDRTTKHTPEATRRMLNAKARKEKGIAYDLFRDVRFCQSEESRLIQMTDVMTGAVAFETNGHHLAENAAQHKIQLMRLITRRAGLQTLAKPSPYKHQGFDIWHLDFSKSKRK